MRSFRNIWLLMAGVAGLSACEGGEPDPPGPSGPTDVTVTVEDRSGATVKGYVSLDGTAAAGVVVSDGVHVTRTDSKGRYWLGTDAESDFVFVSFPSGSEVEVQGWEPRFWYRFHPADTVQRFDFVLHGVDNNHHRMFVISDVHISGRTPGLYEGANLVDSLQFRTFFLPPFQAFARRQEVPCYALNCGDMMQEIHFAKASLPDYKRAIRDFPVPLFHAIGNHDYEPDLPPAAEGDEETRAFKEHYQSNLGPRYYSFNLGKVHYVVLDACRMTGGGSNRYVPHISAAQLAWLEKDLSVVDPSYDLVVATHIAAWRSNAADPTPGTSRSVLDNRDALTACCRGFHHLYFWSGDAHISEVLKVDDTTTQVVHGALGGSVWWSRTCTDGSPAAYTVYDFDGTDLTRTQVPYESSADEQFSLCDGEAPDGTRALIINIPAWELTLSGPSSWQLGVKENGRSVAEAVRFRGYDPAFVRLSENYRNPDTANKPRVTNHLFYYVPVHPDALLSVTVTDGKGRSYRKDTVLNSL